MLVVVVVGAVDKPVAGLDRGLHRRLVRGQYIAEQDQKSNRSDRQFPKILVFNVFVNLPSNSEEYQIENPKLQNMMQ